jgi:hypothetical protein
MGYLEFIARVTSHIPDKGQVTVRYYGLYANAHGGKFRKANLAVFPKLTLVAERPPLPQIAYQEALLAAETSREYFL